MKIIILGRVAEGKSTVSWIVTEHLRSLGFDVQLSDPDIMAPGQYPTLHNWVEHEPQRIDALIKRDTQINVMSVQANRHATEDNLMIDDAVIAHERFARYSSDPLRDQFPVIGDDGVTVWKEIK